MTRMMILSVLALATACGPWGPQRMLAGGPYLGSASEERVDDWTFTDDEMLIGIETRGAWFRHSVTILCVSANRNLYVMARHAPTKRWVQDVGRDPRVRLGIGDKLYAGRAVRVTDPDEADAVARGFLRKYVGIDAPHAHALFGAVPSGDDRAEVWAWRIDPPEPRS
jgi:hypothetical protein